MNQNGLSRRKIREFVANEIAEEKPENLDRLIKSIIESGTELK